MSGASVGVIATDDIVDNSEVGADNSGLAAEPSRPQDGEDEDSNQYNL